MAGRTGTLWRAGVKGAVAGRREGRLDYGFLYSLQAGLASS